MHDRTGISTLDAPLSGWRRLMPWRWRRRPTRWVFDDAGAAAAFGQASLDPTAETAPGTMPAPRPPRTRRWWIVRGIAALLGLFILLMAWLAITAPLSKSLQPIAPPQITLLASDGTPIARSGAVVDRPVAVRDLPPHVVHAFLAIEDRRFYEHWGVDPRGLARALWSNVSGSGITQGGSTITQQLAKMSFLTPERSLTRKAREMLIAFWLEAWLSKDDILGRYLSNAYFGDNVYGLRAASLHYFYRQPERLTPEQAILLAGLVQAPSRFAPTHNPQAARRRADLVRQAMVAAGYLSAAEARTLPRATLDVRRVRDLPSGTYFADWAMPQARAMTETSYESLRLKTALDARLQALAERVVARAPLGGAQVALVAMRRDGAVVAMVGGRDYRSSSFNRATQAQRQPGSTFKLFVWLAALDAGMRGDDLVDDTPIEQGSYRPRNAGNRYRGQIPLREAFVHSSNVVAVRLYNKVGGDAVIREARGLGLEGALPEGDPSLALGTSSASLIDMTAAFAGVAANRWPVQPHAFAAPEPGWFDWLFDRQKSHSARVHEDIETMLRAAVNRGTGRQAQLPIANFGKTGTTQDNRDALFIGYAGDLVVGVWVGRDDNKPLAGVNGGGVPARIWRDFMRQAVAAAAPRRPVVQPAEPEDADIADEDDEADEDTGAYDDEDAEEPDYEIDIPDADLPDEIAAQVGAARLRVGERSGIRLSGTVNGRPVEIGLNENGLILRPRERSVDAEARR